MPPAQLDDHILSECVCVQEDGDEGGGEVEEGVLERGEED